MKTTIERIKNKTATRSTTPGPDDEIQNIDIKRRSMSPAFTAKQQCVVCGKKYDKRGKRALAQVENLNRQNSFMEKAIKLKDEVVVHRIRGGYDNKHIDMVANDICYHRSCMNRYMSTREPNAPEQEPSSSVGSKKEQLDQCFVALLENIHDVLFKDASGFLLVTIRDMFRDILRDRGYPEWDQYKSNRLKLRLQEHYGESSFLSSVRWFRICMLS